jgi:hypothetical protein
MAISVTPAIRCCSALRCRSTERYDKDLPIDNAISTGILLLIIALRCNRFCCSTVNSRRLEAAGATKVSRTFIGDLQATRTAPAEDIRRSIGELNEKKVTPTQENLGVDYIQRATDDVAKSTGKETALYNLFKSSGYGGTEEAFYKDFMPDATEEDKELLSGVLGKDKSKLGFNIDTSDPFAAISSLESLFGDKVKTTTVTEEKPDYFSLFGEAEKKVSQSSSKDSTFNIFNF